MGLGGGFGLFRGADFQEQSFTVRFGQLIVEQASSRLVRLSGTMRNVGMWRSGELLDSRSMGVRIVGTLCAMAGAAE